MNFYLLKLLSPCTFTRLMGLVFFFFCFKSLIILELDLLCGRDCASAEKQGPFHNRNSK